MKKVLKIAGIVVWSLFAVIGVLTTILLVVIKIRLDYWLTTF